MLFSSNTNCITYNDPVEVTAEGTLPTRLSKIFRFVRFSITMQSTKDAGAIAIILKKNK